MRIFNRVEIICAAGMIIFFFLPWAQIFSLGVSGYNLGQLGSYANLVWLIPSFCIFLIVMGLAGKDLKLIGFITGSLPIIGLMYGLANVGSDLFHVVGIGVYLTLLASMVLILTSLGVIRIPQNPNTSMKQGNMSNLWADITKSIKVGIDTVVEKTEELTKIGKIKVDILNINRKIEKEFSELGGKVYKLILEENNTNISKDTAVQNMVKKINSLEKELRAKNEELEQVKLKQGTT